MAQPELNLSAEFPFTLESISIVGSEIRYVDTAVSQSLSAPALLFLHGNTSSAYVWRNIIPSLSDFRCVAPDLIGMGASAKPACLSYGFTDHYTFVAAFIKTIIPKGPIVIIAHDWGTALGLHWAYQHQDRVAGLALLEFVRPFPSWKDFGDDETRKNWQLFRDPVQGRKLIVDQNIILDKMLVHGAKRGLSEAELKHYREPFLEASTREPIWKWTTQIPIAGEPTDVYDIATRYEAWLIKTEIPKLLFYYEDAPLVNGDKMRWYVSQMSNVVSVDVGEAGHFIQEDHPTRVSLEIKAWLGRIMSL
ncbi:twin-arginine translocation pathway signal [Fusarium mexicanum]|uniref:Twin-arginine translocation pathway signal n=1 Tax=Fusarium mexicanum TaxID=751941 RepID=A0A8H5MP10_9HYPO|nr:twin-arginine translocation pathway signal [Fusarium mexicanum]